ncbi:TolC family protein [Pseudochryseolinea flava]|uniref:TolC family protein n=1 Tax=Pseudochryseolinea flava TaxID=2059302 RepID=A0A364XVV3_9BACT|nr:TolC family protein [Pseudochryseolinea flava]RAV98492.1 TolC family protein [Pseudochryseolinea flava]
MQLTLIKRETSFLMLLLLLAIPAISFAQATGNDSTLQSATLNDVVTYALQHRPSVRQSQLDQEITEKVIKGKLADWYPQINFNYQYQRTIDRPVTAFGDNVITVGLFNTSLAQVEATQTIFNRDVLLASKTASKVRIQAEQSVVSTKIEVVVSVTKAFYGLLATAQQIKVNEESIVRLKQSLKDAYSRYQTGVADKTDYKRATILLHNSEASLKTTQERLVYEQQYLKALIGYPADKTFTLQYDTAQMESEINIDTLQQLNYAQHIDYKIMFTQRELQKANVRYSQWAFLPSASAFGAYNLNYLNDNLGELYNTSYPNSFVGAKLTLPIFQGGKRVAKIKEQKLTLRRVDVGLENLQNTLDATYTKALTDYKSNLKTYVVQKENVVLAQEVYDVINLQYRNGVRTYLDVTVAETDLRTARINYFNALNLVLTSKMDVLRALGQINY